jgi:hypothetical protein
VFFTGGEQERDAATEAIKRANSELQVVQVRYRGCAKSNCRANFVFFADPVGQTMYLRVFCPYHVEKRNNNYPCVVRVSSAVEPTKEAVRTKLIEVPQRSLFSKYPDSRTKTMAEITRLVKEALQTQ